MPTLEDSPPQTAAAELPPSADALMAQPLASVALAPAVSADVDESRPRRADGPAVSADELPRQDVEGELVDPTADQLVLAEQAGEALAQLPEPVPPKPVQLMPWNEKAPASAGCWVFWREAGFECRGKMEKGLFTATCRGYGGSAQTLPMEILLRRQFVSQGEAIAVMDSTSSFDPQQAASLGFEITSLAMLAFLPGSAALDEE